MDTKISVLTSVLLLIFCSNAKPGKEFSKLNSAVLFTNQSNITPDIDATLIFTYNICCYLLECCKELKLNSNSKEVTTLYSSILGKYTTKLDDVNKHKAYLMNDDNKNSIMYGTKQGWRVRIYFTLISCKSWKLFILIQNDRYIKLIYTTHFIGSRFRYERARCCGVWYDWF